jgi:hypothetical protein
MMQEGRLHVGLECSDEFIVFSMLPLSRITTLSCRQSHMPQENMLSQSYYDVKLIFCDGLNQAREHYAGSDPSRPKGHCSVCEEICEIENRISEQEAY